MRAGLPSVAATSSRPVPAAGLVGWGVAIWAVRDRLIDPTHEPRRGRGGLHGAWDALVDGALARVDHGKRRAHSFLHFGQQGFLEFRETVKSKPRHESHDGRPGDARNGRKLGYGIQPGGWVVCEQRARNLASAQVDALARARRSVEQWTKAGVDAVIVTASGCGTTIKDYGLMFRNDPAYAEKVKLLEIESEE